MLIQFKKLNHLHSLIILAPGIMLLVIQTLKTFFYSLPFIAVPKPFSFFSVYHQKNVGLSAISMPQHFLPNTPISLTRAWNKGPSPTKKQTMPPLTIRVGRQKEEEGNSVR